MLISPCRLEIGSNFVPLGSQNQIAALKRLFDFTSSIFYPLPTSPSKIIYLFSKLSSRTFFACPKKDTPGNDLQFCILNLKYDVRLSVFGLRSSILDFHFIVSAISHSQTSPLHCIFGIHKFRI